MSAGLATATLDVHLRAIADLPLARVAVAERLASIGPGRFAEELEPVLQRARDGAESGRRGALVVASWVAHAWANGEAARVLAVGVHAGAEAAPLVRPIFAGDAPRAFPRRARLAEVGLPVFANLSGKPRRRFAWQSEEDWREMQSWLARSIPMRRFAVRELRLRARRHHDPVFLGRLLDQAWVSIADAVEIAARRPTTTAVVLAVATRDRWLSCPEVRQALAANPYTPAPLAGLLALTVPSSRPGS